MSGHRNNRAGTMVRLPAFLGRARGAQAWDILPSRTETLALECVSFWILPLATLGMGIEGLIGYEMKRMGKLAG